MGYFEHDGERMRKVLCLRNDVRNVRWIVATDSDFGVFKIIALV